MNFDVNDDFLDIALELEELMDVYLLGEFLEKEQIGIKINELRRKLKGPAILTCKQHILEVLLDDIAQNRHHVQAISKQLADAEGEEQSP